MAGCVIVRPLRVRNKEEKQVGEVISEENAVTKSRLVRSQTWLASIENI